MSAVTDSMISFAKKYGKDMIAALNGSNIYFPVMLVQASIESMFGRSNAAKNRNNFFGIKNGKAVFKSPQDGFAYYVNLLSTKERYANVNNAKDPYEQIRVIADSGYYDGNNDYSLPASQRPPNKYWTAKQSADKYYNTNKGFIDEILLKIPIGKINSQNALNSSLAIK